MKLVFPGGEHPQVLLGPGVNRIGSDPRANIVLDRPGVRPQHCELRVTAHGVMLEVPEGTSVAVNGRGVQGLIALRPGDSVAFERIEARLASVDAATPSHHQPATMAALPTSANDDPGATAVRPVIPRYVLRGVSGAVFGRSYPVPGPTTIGRAPDCTLRIDAEGISRHHARLLPGEHGLRIEDLGSTNGSFLNGKRIQNGLAVAGDEIGFDTMRMRLVAAGSPAAVAPSQPRGRSVMRSPWPWIAAAGMLLIAIWGIAYLG